LPTCVVQLTPCAAAAAEAPPVVRPVDHGQQRCPHGAGKHSTSRAGRGGWSADRGYRRRQKHLPRNPPLRLGFATFGTTTANNAIPDADLILTIGTSLDHPAPGGKGTFCLICSRRAIF
jgi:hypothetical protein